MRHLRLGLATAALTIAAASTGLHATVIDFEGIAGFNANTTETGTRIFGDYYLQQLTGAHGHIMDAQVSVSIPNLVGNGTDWYWHHHFNPFQVGRVDNAAFDFAGFDAADYDSADGVQALVLTLTGYYIGGGSITQTVTTDTIHGFETISLGAGWTNLHHVTIDGVNDLAAFDNLVVQPHTPASVPDAGATASLALAGLAALAAASAGRAGAGRRPQRTG